LSDNEPRTDGASSGQRSRAFGPPQRPLRGVKPAHRWHRIAIAGFPAGRSRGDGSRLAILMGP